MVKMKHLSTLLFEHMYVGIIFFKIDTVCSLDKVRRIARTAGVSNLSVNVIVRDLVSHGILTTGFDDKNELVYIITDFGRYFYDKLYSTDESSAELFEKVGDY